VPFLSYPYEWCFAQLQDAAKVTLEIQRRALSRGMTLKDASAFNVQFIDGRPVFIDTLSFERYQEGQPWVAYRQFCQHFLAPLLLMSRVDIQLGRLLATHLDGIPLNLASRLLPRRTWMRPAWLTHVHLHAYTIGRYADRDIPEAAADRGVSRRGLDALITHLYGAIESLQWAVRTEWSEYGSDHGYGQTAMDTKRRVLGDMVRETAPRVVWDLGANTGTFSRIAADNGAAVIAIDADPGAVQRHYGQIRSETQRSVLPLWIDLTNPSPSLGWNHAERVSLLDRGPADMVLVLALVHHLAISNNVPLPLIASWVADLGNSAVVEFVPKEDPQTRRLLRARKDIFTEYDQEHFELAFSSYFEIVRRVPLDQTERVVYLMRSRRTEIPA
jgi:hypothetical protein